VTGGVPISSCFFEPSTLSLALALTLASLARFGIQQTVPLVEVEGGNFVVGNLLLPLLPVEDGQVADEVLPCQRSVMGNDSRH